MPQKIPEMLYKYRNFDARAISMLANDQVYLASPLEFNDPFDCLAHENMLDAFRPESIEFLARLHPHVSPDAIIILGVMSCACYNNQ